MAQGEFGRGGRSRGGERDRARGTGERGRPAGDRGRQAAADRDASERHDHHDEADTRFGFDGPRFFGGNVGGYGRGGALDHGRGGFDVGGPPEAWGLGDTRHSSRPGAGSRPYEPTQDRYSGGAGYGGIGYGGDGDATRDRGFSGRGPRGYRRSDERIQEEVCELLTRHPGIDASDVEVRVEGGEVTLTGTVDSRRTKRMVEDVVDQCGGVVDVSNQLRIGQRVDAGDAAASTTTEREIARRAEPGDSPRGSTKDRSTGPRSGSGRSGGSRGSRSR